VKKKQLVKRTHDIPEELILRYLEYSTYRLADYFLVGDKGRYQRGVWGADGNPVLLLFFSENQEMDFAIEQFLLRHVPVYEAEAEVPIHSPSSGPETR